MKLACLDCDRTYDPGEARFRCDCRGLLEVSHELQGLGLSRELFESRRGALHGPDRSGVWRFPVRRPTRVAT